MKVTKAQAERNREAIVQQAAALIRERGLDQMNVADVAAAAGLTHGALYRNYGSKDELKADATRQAFDETLAEFDELSAAEFLGRYLSPEHRDHPALGCPNAALASEVWRQPLATREAFRDGLKRFVALTARALEEVGVEQAESQAITVFSTLVGGLALSRAMREVDPLYSDRILKEVNLQLGRLIDQSRVAAGI